jgi:hypothetical protein
MINFYSRPETSIRFGHINPSNRAAAIATSAAACEAVGVSTVESKFEFALLTAGIQKYPPLSQLIDLQIDSRIDRKNDAVKYFAAPLMATLAVPVVMHTATPTGRSMA